VGGWFELVSCPHYFAEILIYTGMCIVRKFAVSQMLVLGWVLINLIMTGMKTHTWYLKKFESYPPNRKAVIPYLL